MQSEDKPTQQEKAGSNRFWWQWPLASRCFLFQGHCHRSVMDCEGPGHLTWLFSKLCMPESQSYLASSFSLFSQTFWRHVQNWAPFLSWCAFIQLTLPLPPTLNVVMSFSPALDNLPMLVTNSLLSLLLTILASSLSFQYPCPLLPPKSFLLLFFWWNNFFLKCDAPPVQSLLKCSLIRDALPEWLHEVEPPLSNFLPCFS